MESQTKVAAIGYVVMYAGMVVAALQNQHRVNAVRMISTPVVMLSVLYGIDCTVKGSCTQFAWMVSYFFLVMGILAVMAVFK